MSPRAAWRLESLGFTAVYDYVPGKADWLANGLPSEGTAAAQPRAGTIVRRDVPTCHLTDPIDTARKTIEGTDWQICVVVNDERIVLGLLGEAGLAADPRTSVEDVMESGPSTWRLNGSLEEIAKYMERHRVRAVVISSSDGKLHGAVRAEDLPAR
jgi:CBS domain-containing protein